MSEKVIWFCLNCKMTSAHKNDNSIQWCFYCKNRMQNTSIPYSDWMNMSKEEQNELIDTCFNVVQSSSEKNEKKDGILSKLSGVVSNVLLIRNNEKNKEDGDKSFLESAEEAANIVTEGLESGDYSAMNHALDALSVVRNNKTKYVFTEKTPKSYYFLIVLSGALSILYLYFFYISEETLRLSREYNLIAIAGMIFTLIMIIISALTIYKIVTIISYNQRYSKYIDILRYRNIHLMDDISDYSKQAIETVEKDIQLAITNKLIPEGHLCADNIVLITSNDTYSKYLENQSSYDRYFRNVAKERVRIEERTEEIQKIMDVGEGYIKAIKSSNDIIKDKNISLKLDHMERLVTSIFYEVDINPSQVDKLGLFIDYYLPTTEKLLEAYIDIGTSRTNAKSKKNSRKSIEDSVDKINIAFENILDQFYLEQEMDIESDIAAMEVMMAQERITT